MLAIVETMIKPLLKFVRRIDYKEICDY